MADSFRAYVVNKDAAGKFSGQVQTCSLSDLPPGEVLVDVAYSSLNYKDALAATGNPGVAKKFPHVPGIDAAGTVAASDSAQIAPGSQVLVTGYDLGVSRWGGFAERVRVPAEWVVALPPGLTLRESMLVGTAGFTAAQCVDALIAHGVEPAAGQIVVTGASGGVGSLAVAILAKLGYKVTAISGKPAAQALLMELGASEVLPREAVLDASPKPLLPTRWAGAVDTVGGATLATILRATAHRGCVTACGLVGGHDLNLTVFPFILRAVSLVGIDSSYLPRAQRLSLWARLANEWKPARLESLAHETSLDDVGHHVEEILAGRVAGRVIVKP
jgi:putative YhdH/YhfP family quinone oxidoreductase